MFGKEMRPFRQFSKLCVPSWDTFAANWRYVLVVVFYIREAAASGGGKREHFGNFDHSCTQIDRQKDGLGK